MKVSYAHENVLGSSGIKETQKFQIAATPQAFKILSSGLYSDKIRAVLREIGCNAMDAHIAAGEPNKPFRVKIPNALDDQFYIQDWGPGLSHEEVMKLYSTYFASTKQTSNAFTGAFGLGSKSPFSYTGQFHVTSTHGGKKRTYSLYIGNDGAPNVSLLSEEEPDADWANGMRVGFAVRPEDANEFAEKANDVFQWFRVAPEMRGVPAVKTVEYKFACDEFGFLEDGERGKLFATMGNVCYPVDTTKLGLKDVQDEEAAKDILNYAAVFKGLVLYLPIGEVQVTASREHLEYDPRSVKVLKELLRLAVKRAGKDAVEAIEATTEGGWDSLCTAKEKVEQLMEGMRWHFSSLAKALGIDAKKAKEIAMFVNRERVDIAANKLPSNATYYIVTNTSYRGRGRVGVYTNRYYIDIKPSTVVMVGLAPRLQSRAKRAVAEGVFAQVLVVGRRGKEKVSETDLVDGAREMAKEMGGVPVVNPADHEPYASTATASKTRKKKGWMPSLPTGVDFPCKVLGKDARLELGDSKLSDNLFACHVEKSRWNNTSYHMRVFDTTDADDQKHDWGVWGAVWDYYVKVQKTADLPDAPTAYAKLTPTEIRRIALLKLGWKNAYPEIKAYLERPELRVELRKSIKKKHLAAPMLQTDVGMNDWLSGIAWYMGDRKKDALVRAKLEDLGLWDTVEGMVDARGSGKGTVTVPEAVTAYQWLARHFRIEDDLSTDVRDALTVEDVDALFRRRFPRTNLLYISEVLNDSDDASELIAFVLSKEE